MIGSIQAYLPQPPYFEGTREERIAKENAYWRQIWTDGEAKHLRGETEKTYETPLALASAYYEKLREQSKLRIDPLRPMHNDLPPGAISPVTRASFTKVIKNYWAGVP